MNALQLAAEICLLAHSASPEDNDVTIACALVATIAYKRAGGSIADAKACLDAMKNVPADAKDPSYEHAAALQHFNKLRP